MGRPPARTTLTPREREVVDLLGQGLSNAEIADRLDVGTGAVSAYARAGIRKLVQRLTVLDDHGLTSRESDVLTLLGQGLSDAQLASRLEIGQRTAETYVSRLLKKMGRRRADIAPMIRGTDRSGLTARERQVLSLLKRGLSNAAIAKELGVTQRTAESHVAAVLRKMGKRSRVELRA